MLQMKPGRRSCLAWLCGCDEARVPVCQEPFPCGQELEFVLKHYETQSEETRRRLVHIVYALAAAGTGAGVEVRLAWPSIAGQRLRALYPDRASREPLLKVLDNLSALRESCEALPDGTIRVAEGTPQDILQLTRTGKAEILTLVCSRSSHLYAADIGPKSAEVNPYGFTITVEDIGHNPDHSYFDQV